MSHYRIERRVVWVVIDKRTTTRVKVVARCDSEDEAAVALRHYESDDRLLRRERKARRALAGFKSESEVMPPERP